MSSRILLADDDEPKRAAPPEPPAPEKPEPPTPPAPEPRPEPPPAREAQTDSAPESEGEPTAEAPKPELPPEFQKRLDRVTWEKYEARRQADELSQRLQQIEREQQQARTGGAPDPVETAKQQLREENAAREFNKACNDLVGRGRQEYNDFDDAIKALNAVGYANRPDALTAITQLPDGHRVYRELASDLDNAARVLSLPPMAMAIELARMSTGATPARPEPEALPPAQPVVPITRAPEPLRAVGGTSARAQVPLEKTSMADFIRRRDAEERGSRIRR
jgi:hypothetical protein